MSFNKTVVFLLIVASSNGALAGSLISTNLPANTTIVNIEGFNDGAHVYDGDQSNWYQPFSQNGTLLELTLDPGTYRFGIVDATDARARFPLLTPAQLATVGGAWSYNTPWATDYLVYDSSALNDPNQPQLFSGAVVPKTALPGYGNTGSAYSAAKAGGYDDKIVVSPGGRYHGTTAASFTLATRKTLIFAVPDYILTDNLGTVSVVVQGVPEPTTLVALSLGTLAFLRRRFIR